MNGKRWIAILLAGLMLLSLAACSKADPDAETQTSAEPTPAPEAADTPAPSAEAPAEPAAVPEGRFLVVINKETEQVLSPDGEQVILDFSCETPEVTGSGAEEINRILQEKREAFFGTETENGDPPAGLTGYKEAALEEYQWRQSENIPSANSYSLNRSVTVARGDGAVLSFLYDEYSYTGGAHGYTARTGLTFRSDGTQLFFDDLSTDPEGLRQFCVENILGQIQSLEFGEYSFISDYESVIPQLVADNTWYLSPKGLVIVANPYDIAAYAFGRIEFTISYALLEGHVHDWLIPAEGSPEGRLAGSLGGESDPTPTAQVDDGTGGQGQPVLFRAEGRVQDVRLMRMGYDEFTGGFVEEGLLWYASALTDGEILRILTWVPEVMPNLRISYRGENGRYQAWYISMSGMDGSLLLLDAADFTTLPRNITEELPFRYDLDGDGGKELIAVESYVSDQLGSTALRVTVTKPDGTVEAADTNVCWDHCLWLADGDGDGRAELFFSGDMASDDYALRGWRYDGTLTPVLFSDSGETRDWLSGWISYVNSDRQFNIHSVRNVLGTYWAARPFRLGENGVMAPAEESQWQFLQNEYWLELAAALPAVMSDGTETVLPAGTSIQLTGTDGESWVDFLTSDYTIGRLTISSGENGWLVGGVSEWEAFVTLPYAG